MDIGYEAGVTSPFGIVYGKESHDSRDGHLKITERGRRKKIKKELPKVTERKETNTQ